MTPPFELLWTWTYPHSRDPFAAFPGLSMQGGFREISRIHYRWTSETVITISHFRALAFQLGSLRDIYKLSRVLSPSSLTSVLFVCLLCSPVTFEGLLKKDSKLCRCRLSVISHSSLVPSSDLSIRLCSQPLLFASVCVCVPACRRRDRIFGVSLPSGHRSDFVYTRQHWVRYCPKDQRYVCAENRRYAKISGDWKFLSSYCW